MSWVCTNCNAPNDESSMKCAHCGQIRKIKCRALGCGFSYSITEPRCPQCGEPNPFYVSKMTKPGLTTACPRCGFILNNKMTPNCPQCGEPNPGYILKPGEMFCQYCKKLISVNDKTCPKCGRPNKAYQPTKPVGEATKKRISGRLYEILMYIIAGIAVIFIPPFFGLPSFRYLGIALMAFMPFYIILPSESDIRGSIKAGEVEIPPGKVGLLVTKAMAKLLIFFFIAYLELFPLNRLIALIFTFAFYFTLPVSYKESQPYRLIESWARPFAVGTYLSFLIFMTFAGSGGIANAGPGASLFFMSIAFFVWSFPTHKEEREEGVVKLVVSTKLRDLSKSSGFIAVERYIFFTFMLFAIGMSGLNFGNIFSTTGTTELTFFAVWLLSLISGIISAPEGRPYIGAFMIFIAIFVFTFTYTGVMGEAVFGYWWPQVESFGESIAAPLAPMWAQVQSGMGDTWLMLTNPMAYYNQMQQKQQATKSVVTTGGTTKSIELTRTDLFTSLSGILEPKLDPVIGSFEIQNQGEFEANSIELKIWALWQNPKDLTKQASTGSLITFNCSRPPYTAATFRGGIGTCNWDETTYPGEIKLSTFVFNKDSWGLTGVAEDPNLDICVVKNPDGSDMCRGSTDECCNNLNSTYVHAGQIVRFNANITYYYNVNVSIPAEVIDWSTYANLLQAKEITLQELTSQYTGGPVKATLWSQKQPIRAGEVALFVASIYNDGGGNIIEISNFAIKIPKELGIVEKISSTFYGSGGLTDDGCGPNRIVNPGGGDAEIDCHHTWANHPIKPGEYKRVSFLVTPPSTMSVDRMTRLITGLATYKYIKTSSQSLTVANNYPH